MLAGLGGRLARNFQPSLDPIEGLADRLELIDRVRCRRRIEFHKLTPCLGRDRAEHALDEPQFETVLTG